jgi:hypothetical protein
MSYRGLNFSRSGAALLAGVILITAASSAWSEGPDGTTKAINELLAAKWTAQKLTPAERTSDSEFVRRVYLDIVGRIPTADEAKAFEQDAGADKRAKLVDRLLASPEYASNWAVVWTCWLVPRNAPRLGRDQLNLGLSEELEAANSSYKSLVTKLLTVSGKSNDEVLVNFLLPLLGHANSAKQFAEEGQYDMVPATLRTLRLFLGYRLDGLEHPEHAPPNSDWKAKDFWGVNVFFRQVQGVGPQRDAEGRAAPVEVHQLLDNPAYNAKGMIVFDAGKGVRQPIAAVFLDGTKLKPDDKRTRRAVLAELITRHDNFAKAYVNRMWGHFFGRGLHERPTVDDFGSHHKLLHPELLDRLAKDFAQGGYDPKKLIRWICASDAYQLKSVANATNAKPEAEPYFSRMPLKIMTPEQLGASLVVAGDKDKDLAFRERVLSPGRALDLEWDELAFHDRVIRSMTVINRREISEALLRTDSGPVARALQADSPAKAADALYRAALSRAPTAKEVARIEQEVAKAKKGGDKDLEQLWQDVYWALLNSSEFLLNH